MAKNTITEILCQYDNKATQLLDQLVTSALDGDLRAAKLFCDVYFGSKEQNKNIEAEPELNLSDEQAKQIMSIIEEPEVATGEKINGVSI